MFLVRLLSRLPLRILYIISDILFFLGYYVVRYRRKLVSKNLKNSFPETSADELKKIEKKFYRNLCDYAVETLKLLTISREELTRRFRFTNYELPERFKQQNQSVLYLASHQFNWEWLLTSASITYPTKIDFVYQRVKNAFFDRISLQARTRFGAYPIRRDEVAREIVKRRPLLRGIATVADQYPGYDRDKKYYAQFLNQETVFFAGTNQLAIMTQYPAIGFDIKKIKRGYYEATPVLIASPPYSKDSETVVENYVRHVEQMIRKDPAGWLWSHNRWKKRHLAANRSQVKSSAA